MSFQGPSTKRRRTQRKFNGHDFVVDDKETRDDHGDENCNPQKEVRRTRSNKFKSNEVKYLELKSQVRRMNEDDLPSNEASHSIDDNEDVIDIKNVQVKQEENDDVVTVNEELDSGNSNAPNGGKKFRCKICTSWYASKNSLAVHMRIHNDERPYSCEKCDMAFRTSSALSTHQVRHTGEKRFECDICGKKFTRMSTVKIHQRLHDKNPPQYECEYCEKIFHHKSNRTTHLFTHLAETPYKCEYCKKNFNALNNLKVHVRVNHTFETPYQCDKCDRAFKMYESWKSHQVVHDETREFGCPHCSNRFHSTRFLNSHITRQHSEMTH